MTEQDFELQKLRQQNVELREKYISRFDQIKCIANICDMADMIYKFYDRGYIDGHAHVEEEWDSTFILDWLQEVGEI